jgi:hypothetical protein
VIKTAGTFFVSNVFGERIPSDERIEQKGFAARYD